MLRVQYKLSSTDSTCGTMLICTKLMSFLFLKKKRKQKSGLHWVIYSVEVNAGQSVKFQILTVSKFCKFFIFFHTLYAMTMQCNAINRFYDASRFRRGWFCINAVMDHNRLSPLYPTNISLTSFVAFTLVTCVKWRREVKDKSEYLKKSTHYFNIYSVCVRARVSTCTCVSVIVTWGQYLTVSCVFHIYLL